MRWGGKVKNNRIWAAILWAFWCIYVFTVDPQKTEKLDRSLSEGLAEMLTWVNSVAWANLSILAASVSHFPSPLPPVFQNLDLLLSQVCGIVEKHTENNVLEACALLASALFSDSYTFSSRAHLAFSQLLDELTECFSSYFNDLLQVGKQVGESFELIWCLFKIFFYVFFPIWNFLRTVGCKCVPLDDDLFSLWWVNCDLKLCSFIVSVSTGHHRWWWRLQCSHGVKEDRRFEQASVCSVVTWKQKHTQKVFLIMGVFSSLCCVVLRMWLAGSCLNPVWSFWRAGWTHKNLTRRSVFESVWVIFKKKWVQWDLVKLFYSLRDIVSFHVQNGIHNMKALF